MRTKLGYAVSALLSFLLCAVLLCGTVLPTAAAEAELPSLNYSNPTMANNKSLSAYELYLALLDRVPTEGETMYWQGSDFSLTYSDAIPESSINTEYSSDTETLMVSVSPYTYTAANGVTVSWIPQSIELETVDGTWKKYSLTKQESGTYDVKIEGCVYSGDFGVKVFYTCDIVIARSIVKKLLTEAYNEGNAAWELMKEYEAKKLAYDTFVNEQAFYEQYIQQKEAYENYIAEKALYDKLLEAYKIYDEEYKAYLAIIDAEQQWVNYYKQQEDYKNNKVPYNNYLTYYNSYKAAVDKLAMFESIYKAEDRGWSMYGDIMGSAVTQVLSNQDLLIAGGCDEDDIHLAGQSTENLRVLLKAYNDLRKAKYSSNHVKYQTLYQYYIDHYDALKLNFCNLYKTLKGLYENDAVHYKIATMEKSVHYRQLVGHLFVIARALDQDSYLGDDWTIDDRPLREVIRDIHYFQDGDWDPKNTPFPEKEVPVVEKIEEPVLPTVKRPDQIPDAPPTEVPNPGEAPVPVEKPQDTPPIKPEPIGPEPQSPEPGFSEAVKVLYKEVRDGQFSDIKNYYVPETVTLTLTKEIQPEPISIHNLKTVTFYDAYGNVYHQERKNYGETIDLPIGPEKAETAATTYKFNRWIYADGKPLEGNRYITVTQNISLYPEYSTTPRLYTVTLIVNRDGKEVQRKTVAGYYGDPLNSKFVNIPPANDGYSYAFSGWHNSDGELLAESVVTENATYVGYIQQIPKKFNVTWVVNEKNESITEQWEYNQKPSVPENLDLSISSPTYLYTFLGWDKTISRVTRDVTYTARYEKTALATAGNTVLDVLHSDTEVTVLATSSSVSAKTAAALALAEGKALTLCWDGLLSVSLSGEELQKYVDMGTDPILTLQVSQEGGIEVYDLKYSTSNATAVFPSADIQFPYHKADGRETLFEMQTAQGWVRLDKGHVRVAGDIKVRRTYAYSILYMLDEKCDVRQEGAINQAIEGEWVSIDLNCVYGYKVVGATILTTDGETIDVTGVSFQMPASAATVTLKIEQIVYRVIFMVDGVAWKTYEYHAGDEIVLPPAPTKAAEEGYVYTFIGWGNVPALAMGEEEELVFEASFTKAQVLNDYDTGNNNNVLFGIILPCVAAALVLLIVFLILNRIVRKRGGWKVVCGKITARIRTSLKERNEKKSQKKVADVKSTQNTKPQATKSTLRKTPRSATVQAPKTTASASAPKTTSAQTPKSASTPAQKSTDTQKAKSASTQQSPKNKK